jgi:xylan 1,4-beta-xylosidase
MRRKALLAALATVPAALMAASLIPVLMAPLAASQGGPRPAAVLVQVDFAQRVRGVKSMTGFLHSMDKSQPPDDLVLPLRPALWRIGWYQWNDGKRDRLARMRVPTIVVASDLFPGSYNEPLRDFTAWGRRVRTLAREAQDQRFIWDIWNEPDHKEFWKGSEADFLEAFGVAARALREELGSKATISGPSITKYDVPFLTRFLEYCRAQRIVLDVLSWHELQVDNDIPSIAEHLRDARTRFVNNPRFKSVGIKKIQINEITGPSAQHFPAEVLAYLRALELGGADGACRACWDTCSDNTLDGLLVPGTNQPRAAWWAYKYYAASVASRVQSRSSDRRIVSFASQGAGDETRPQVLVAYFAHGETPPAADVVLQLHNVHALRAIGRHKRAGVRIERIPNTGERAVPRLEVIAEFNVPIINGGVEIGPINLNLHECYVVTLAAGS